MITNMKGIELTKIEEVLKGIRASDVSKESIKYSMEHYKDVLSYNHDGYISDGIYVGEYDALLDGIVIEIEKLINNLPSDYGYDIYKLIHAKAEKLEEIILETLPNEYLEY